MITFTCFGEILWDVFPTYRRIGGAPLNVALRLHSLGARVYMVSRLGNDLNGNTIDKHIGDQGLSTRFIQRDESLSTGSVDVHLDQDRTATYTIHKPVAWDAIDCSPEIMNAVKESDALIFGSLVCRSPQSKHSLEELIPVAKFRIFDLNLRPPHYDLDLIVSLMHRSDLIKMNDEELDEISSYLGLSVNSIQKRMVALSEYLKKDLSICVTKGAAGAELQHENRCYQNVGYPVSVADTVGAGDSFLATLSYNLLNGTPPQKALDRACAMGSLVASREGANPKVEEQEIIQMLGVQ
jgi:fructokinase